MVHIWLLLIACLARLNSLSATKITFVSPSAGHVWVYNMNNFYPLRYRAAPHVPQDELPKKVVIAIERLNMLSKNSDVFSYEIESESFYRDAKWWTQLGSQKDPQFRIHGSDSIPPPRLIEGYHRVIIRTNEGEIIGASEKFMVLNGIPSKRSDADLVAGFKMSWNSKSFKLLITRQLRNHETIVIKAVNTYKASTGGTFLDRPKESTLVLDREITDECVGASQVCKVPMQQFDFNMGIFFEVYVVSYWGLVQDIVMRTQVHFAAFKDELIQTVCEVGSKAMKGTILALKYGTWFAKEYYIRVMEFAKKNPGVAFFATAGAATIYYGSHIFEHIQGIGVASHALLS